MAKMGPPIKYKEDFVRQAFVACSEGGFTNAKLAKLLQVDIATIYQWKLDYPDLSDAINSGKDIWNSSKAEKCMMKRVTGYKYTETTREPDDDGNLKISKTVRKSVAPDVTAQIFWLKNRSPERWRDRKELDIDLKNRTSDELDNEIAQLSGALDDADGS